MGVALSRAGTMSYRLPLNNSMTSKLFKSFQTLVILLALMGVAHAQFPGPSHTKVSILLAQTSVRPGESVQGVIRLKMDEHWHTYWRYAGDVGLPTTVDWTLPPGWSAGPLLFPAPTLIDTSGLISYAYEGEVDLPFTLTPNSETPSQGPQKIKAKIAWLECKESCVPGEIELNTSFQVAPQTVDSSLAKQVQAAFAALPPKRQDLALTRNGAELFLHLPNDLKEPIATATFFPDTADQIVLAAPQVLKASKAGNPPVLVLQPSPDFNHDNTTLSGVLSITTATQTVSWDVQLKIGDKSTSSVAAPTPTAASLGQILLTVLFAFVGGLILNLMPCVFPVLSLKVLGIVEQSRQEGTKAWYHGLVFGLGVLTSFWLLSGMLLVARAAGAQVGWGFQLQNPGVIAGLATLFLLIGLNLFGVFEVGERLTSVSSASGPRQGFAHSFWSGVLTTIAATPCTAPFMGGAVGFALSQPTYVAWVIFSALALGVAAPYITLTLFPALLTKLPKPGAWMVTFKQLLAFPMLLATVWLSWVFGSQVGNDRLGLLLISLVITGFAAWVYGHWGTSFQESTRRRGMVASVMILGLAFSVGYQASQPQQHETPWQTYSPELVDRLVAEGKPVFLDFTADWCTSCKANELLALSRPEVQQRFKDLKVNLVQGDWTKQDPIITAALEKFGRAGVPLYVLYPGHGQEPIVLPELLVPSTVLKALEAVKTD